MEERLTFSPDGVDASAGADEQAAAEPYSAQVLVVDDEEALADALGEALRRLGHVCTLAHDFEAARDELEHGAFDLIATDLVLDPADKSNPLGLEVLRIARQTQHNAEVIVVTGHGDIPTAKAAIKGGAYDFIEKPLDLELFRNLCQRAIQTVQLRARNTALQREMDDRFGIEGIIGSSAGIQRVIATIRQVAGSDISVLVTGESGTGKELVARALHSLSPRAKKRFKPLNCAGLSESILESELFGHVQGAFTTAERDREGVFEYAHGGTLFLDEIGDMPMSMQAKLLRVLESGEIVRVGANEPRHVDVRLIAATNHDLRQLVDERKFREDLYYRVAAAHIEVPALRQRREDVPQLVRHYVRHFASRMGKGHVEVDEDVMQMLVSYDWPGNVRQLMHVVQNMVLVTEGDRIQSRHVPMEIRSASPGGDGRDGGIEGLAGLTLEQIEKQAIRNALRLHNGNREATARMLGIGERTLYRKLKEYNLK